jgi:hypothetical protein
MAINRVLAVIPVADFAAALAWYERLLGRPADIVPMEGLAEWHITETGGIQVLHDAEHAGTALLTLTVDDLDALVASLAAKDFPVGGITTGVVARFASITDAEGNTVTFAEALGAGN